MKVLLIAAHPDDIEFFASYLCLQSLKAGWEVHELIASCDEYGTADNKFKGIRIRNIRRKEMIDTAKTYSKNLPDASNLILHWMDYIDGHVPHDEKSINRTRNFIQKINPDIIAGPDPFIYFDGHRDHLATGKNYYMALNTMKASQRPKLMLYWQSLMPNFFLPPINRNICLSTWKKHKTQTDFVTNFFWKTKQLLYFPHLVSNNAGWNGEGYRKVTFSKEKNIHKGLAKLLFRFIFSKWSFGDIDENLFLPSPEDLGLQVNPTNEIS